jgi:predicted metal-dependent phosphoesterase TrpH
MPQRGTIFADLHTHTTASDGVLTPTELVRRAFERGLKALAVTDHDTVAGVSEAARIAAELQMWFCSGIEISAYLRGRERHILGYGMDVGHRGIAEYARRARAHRERRAERIVERLLRERRVKKFSMDDVRAESKNAVVGRQHIAMAMWRRGIVRSVRQAFDIYLADEALAEDERWEFPAAEAIALIQEAGGLAVVAHPSRALDGEDFQDLLDAGIDGVELHHPSHDADVCLLYKTLAEQHNLLKTGGSDFHGGNKRDGSNIGRYGLTKDDFDEFSNALAELACGGAQKI